MKTKNLGKTSLEVSALGLGCMGFSHASGTPNTKADAIAVIRESLAMGYTFFDTAECYTGVYPDGTISYNEEVVGEALAPYRDQVVIATKFGVQHGKTGLIMDSRPSTIRKSVEGSLQKLGTDYIDLYYQHRIDPKVSPEEVAYVMKELIQEGTIKAWGISETTEEYLRRAHAICPVTAIQNRYSMMARWHECIFPTLEELGIRYVAFSPLANGFLTGQYDAHSTFESKVDYRSEMPQYSTEGYAKGKPLLMLLSKIAQEKQATLSQISLAWMLCKKPYIIPIPGSRKIERIKENMNATKVILSKDEIQKIDQELDNMDFMVFGGH